MMDKIKPRHVRKAWSVAWPLSERADTTMFEAYLFHLYTHAWKPAIQSKLSCKTRVPPKSIVYAALIKVSVWIIIRGNDGTDIQVCLDNSDLYNSESAITRTTFGQRNPAGQLNCFSITRNLL